VITYLEVEDEVAQIVAERPRFIYIAPDLSVTAQYVHEDHLSGNLSRGCIVAHWAHQFHGVSLTALHCREGMPADLAIRSLRLQLERRAITFLQRLQKRQDEHYTWLEAFEDARALATSVRYTSAQDLDTGAGQI